jgi:hypothetical protein
LRGWLPGSAIEQLGTEEGDGYIVAPEQLRPMRDLPPVVAGLPKPRPARRAA